jgi:hypothetical protein
MLKTFAVMPSVALASVRKLRRPIGRVLRRAFVDERVHSATAPRRPLTLAKIFDEGLQVLGIDAGAISVDDYTASRSLAVALHQEFPDLVGVACRSRYDNGEICFGVFDRVNASDLVADGAKRARRRAHEPLWRVVRYESAGSVAVARGIRRRSRRPPANGPPPVTSRLRCVSAIVLLSGPRDVRGVSGVRTRK